MAEGTSAPGGNPPDQKTIKKTKNGKLAVTSYKSIFLDLENSSDLENDTDWKYSTSDTGLISTNGGAQNTSNYLNFRGLGNDNIVAERQIDFSNIDDLTVYYAIDINSKGYTGSSNDTIKVKIDGNVEFSKSGGSSQSWTKITIDTSSIDGFKTIELQNDNSSSNRFYIQFDRVRTNVLRSQLDGTVNQGAGGI